jgi:uncharacterized membrane protein YozB (DUF420 family)
MWLLLLLAQSVLVSKQRVDIHRKLGLASIVLVPCILVSMYGMDMYGVETFDVQTTVVTSGATPQDQIAQLKQYASSILLIHGASYLLFPAFFLWAILVRRRDNETHKRMMILATLVLMIPGLGRLLSITRVLPDFGLDIIDARHYASSTSWRGADCGRGLAVLFVVQRQCSFLGEHPLPVPARPVR